MISSIKLFGDLFNTNDITPDRLVIFAKDLLARLTKANASGAFTAQIATLTTYIASLEADISGVDTTLNLQSGQTDEVDLLTHNFGARLSILEGVIAFSLGGVNTIAYKEFFPRGLSEYNKITRPKMPTFVARIKKAAIKYSTELGAIVANELEGFEAKYVAARDAQNTSITGLSSTRIDRNKAERDMQKGLTQSVHLVGSIYPTDIVKCSACFNFNLLYTVAHRKHVLYIGTLIEDETRTIINRSFTDNVTITIRSKGTNAGIEVWLAATADGLPTILLATVAPGKASIVVPSSLGDIDNTFLLIKNASAVNGAVYEVETIG